MAGSTKRWIIATAVAGSLDLISAFVFSAIAGTGPDKVLTFVASGPFGDTMLTGGLVAFSLGVAVHYTLMATMVAIYIVVADHVEIKVRRPWIAGMAYGVLLWIVMYWIVRPLRWPTMPLPHTAFGIAEQLFSHTALVGIPIAVISAGGRANRRSRAHGG